MDAAPREKSFEFIEVKRVSQAVSVDIKQAEDDEDGSEAKPVDDHESSDLVRLDGHVLRVADDEREKKLQRIDIKEDDKEKYGIQSAGDGRLQSIAAKIMHVRAPYEKQQRKTNAEGRELKH